VPRMKPKAREDLTVVELDGEAVIYDEVGGDLHHLNSSATIIFALCDGTQTVKQMSAEIAEVFSLASQDVEAQVRTVVRDLRSAGLLDEERLAHR
jgi:PqqD family protein of HPr-rel-A system